MQEITVKAYYFNELSDLARERAREWYRTKGIAPCWWGPIFDKAKESGIHLTTFCLSDWSIKGTIDDCYSTICDILTDPNTSRTTKAVAKEALANRGRAWAKWYHNYEPRVFENSERHKTWGDLATQRLLFNQLYLLRKEYDYLVSDEAIDQELADENYLFTIGGSKAIYL